MKLLISFLLSVLLISSAKSQNNTLTGELDSLSYSLGILLGTSIRQAGIEDLNDKMVLNGLNDVSTGKQPVITLEQANMVVNAYLAKLNEKRAFISLLEGRKFLDENSNKEGVVTLPSGLQYKVIREGSGSSPSDTSVVTVNYTGTFTDGKVFDSSVQRGEPASFPVNRVIPGWTEALQLMKPGANWILYIPSELAYGENGPEGIGANKVLIFDVELLSFK